MNGGIKLSDIALRGRFRGRHTEPDSSNVLGTLRNGESNAWAILVMGGTLI